MSKKKDAVSFEIIALDGKPVSDAPPNDAAEQPCESRQLVLEAHNETFRLPEDWVRFRDWAEDLRRAAMRNPRYRPEDDTVDHHLRAARQFICGVKGWEPDVFYRMTPQEYEDSLIGHYGDAPPAHEREGELETPSPLPRGLTLPPRAREAKPCEPLGKTGKLILEAIPKILGWKTMTVKERLDELAKELGRTAVGRSTYYRVRAWSISRGIIWN
jgi:hypothetical protein